MERLSVRHDRASLLPGVAVVVSLILLGGSSSAGAVTAGSTTYPPFTGTVAVFSHVISISGCAHEKLTVKPFWNQSASTGGWGGNASARACPSTMGTAGNHSRASYSQRIELGIPVKIPKSGWHNMTVNWTSHLHAFESFTWDYPNNSSNYGKDPCPAGTVNSTGFGFEHCLVIASTSLSVTGYLEDITLGISYPIGRSNQSFYSFVNYRQSDDCNPWRCVLHNGSTAFSFGSFNSSFSGYNTSDLNIRPGQPLKGGDKFVLVVEIHCKVLAKVRGDPFPMKHGSAFASLDLGSSGLGLTINWISVA